MPSEVAESGAPDATDKQVRLETMRGGRFAVYRSPASWSRENLAQAESKLIGWIQQQGLQPPKEPRIANYDPPSTPAFFQRNEMLVRVANRLRPAADIESGDVYRFNDLKTARDDFL